MDALEFAKERNRMCHSFPQLCKECPAYMVGSCYSITNMENLVPVVEKWSAEHPLIRNVDHIAEGLEKLGFKVDKWYMAKYLCPVNKSTKFNMHAYNCEGSSCEECRKWWLEEWKGGKNNV